MKTERISIKQLNKFGESSDIIISFDNLFFNVCKYLKSSENIFIRLSKNKEYIEYKLLTKEK